VEPSSQPVPVALTIAGHDPSSGAGATADLQTFAAHGVFGLSAITALTVQSTLGVAAVEPVSPRLLRQVLLHLEADTPAQGVKLGMLASAENAAEAALYLHGKVQANPNIPSVFDPVLVSSSGATMLGEGGLEIVRRVLLPEVRWITPNWAELAVLAEQPVGSLAEAEAAAHALGTRYPHLFIVATAGDQPEPVDLLRLPSGEVHTFSGTHLETSSTHGTGCAFSSALLGRLLLGENPQNAVFLAKKYVTQAILSAPPIGQGRGPLHLLWPLGLPRP
jgi:hydroxymethylpyrimidine/phosphomethylpyrimidine kinase